MANYWVCKSEEKVYSISDLERDGTTFWEGVRNYQARNFIRDDMKIGDLVIFYHSNADPAGAAGVCEIVKEAYPDHFAFDPESKYFDAKAREGEPRWFMMDVKFVKKFKRVIPIKELKENPKLQDMQLVKRGNRLSVMPATKAEFDAILEME